MKKLRLKLEELAVDSFDTDAPEPAKGTVEGRAQYTVYRQTDEQGCSMWHSCGYTWCTCGDNAQTCNFLC